VEMEVDLTCLDNSQGRHNGRINRRDCDCWRRHYDGRCGGNNMSN
jgi:hypothetical protein